MPFKILTNYQQFTDIILNQTVEIEQLLQLLKNTLLRYSIQLIFTKTNQSTCVLLNYL